MKTPPLPDADDIRKAFKDIPRERWATVLGMIFVQQMPLQVLEAIALGGRREFLKWGKKTDVVGLKADDYSDVYTYVLMAVQRFNQIRVEINAAKAGAAIGPGFEPMR